MPISEDLTIPESEEQTLDRILVDTENILTLLPTSRPSAAAFIIGVETAMYHPEWGKAIANLVAEAGKRRDPDINIRGLADSIVKRLPVRILSDAPD